MKEHPWVEHLACLPKRGMGALLIVSALYHERAPMSCLQRLDALKVNNWQKKTYNEITSSFKVEFWWHTTLWKAPCDCEHRVACGAQPTALASSVYVKVPRSNLQYNITQSFSPQICIALGAVCLQLHMQFAPDERSSELTLTLYRKLGQK